MLFVDAWSRAWWRTRIGEFVGVDIGWGSRWGSRRARHLLKSITIECNPRVLNTRVTSTFEIPNNVAIEGFVKACPN